MSSGGPRAPRTWTATLHRALTAARSPGTLLATLRARQGSFAVGSAITVVISSAASVVYGGASILLARALGPEQTGLLTWFLNGTATFALFADILAVYYSNAYMLAREGHGFSLATVRGTVLSYGAVVGLVCGLVFGLIPPVREAVFQHFDDPLWGSLIVLNILGGVLANEIRSLFWGKSDFMLVSASNFARIALFALVGLVFAYGFGWRKGTEIAIAQVVATWVSIAFFLAYFALRGGIGRPKISYLRACVGIGWRALVVNWLGFLQLRSDQFLVNSILGAAALGLYGTIVTLSGVLVQIPGMLGLVLFSIAARDKDQQGAARATVRRTAVVMGLTTLLAIPAAYFAPAFIPLVYGKAFSAAVPVLQYLLPSVVFLAGLQLVNNHVGGMGYPTIQLVAIALSLIINTGCNLWLLPTIGVVGASISSSISYCVWLAMVGGYLYYKARARPGSSQPAEVEEEFAAV